MKRVVLDTNVTVSALFWKGYPRVVYDLAKGGKVTIVSSLKMEAELIRVLKHVAYTRIREDIQSVTDIIDAIECDTDHH